MKVIVFDIGGTLMEYKGMPLSWLDYYKTAFEFARSELGLGITDEDIEKSYEVLKKYNPRINPREHDVSPEVIFAEATAHWQGNFSVYEEQEITGTIKLAGDVATVTLYAPWSDTWFKDVNEYQYYRLSDEQLPATENVHVDEVNVIEENEVESIQDEIAKVEEKSREHCNIDSSSMGQQQMNDHSAQWYQLWDDELNSLWSRLSDELDADTKAKVLEEQRAWIKRKEGNVTAAGLEALGGTLQPLLESETAGAMTRARVYILAGYLADVRNESFTISTELQESLDMANPSLDDIFAQFEGQWIFDAERGACVGIERTEACAYGVEGSNWTIWVTGGGIFSDMDVYGYTETNILFKVTHDDFDAFYELSFGTEHKLILTYRTSLSADAMNDYDVIVCD